MVVYLLWVNNDENMSCYLLYFRKKKNKTKQNKGKIFHKPLLEVERIDGLMVQRLDGRVQVELPKAYARESIPLPLVAGDDPNKQTNEKRNFEGCVAAGMIRDYFTGRQNKKTTENQR